MPSKDDQSEYTLKDFRQKLTMIVGDVQHGNKRVKVTSYGRTAGYFISEEEMDYYNHLESQLDEEVVQNLRAKFYKKKS